MCKLLNGKSFLFAALLLSAVSMSCSHDPHDENQDPSNTDVHEWEDSTLSGDAVMGSAMTFKVGGGMSVERTAQTRATTDINGIATFTEGDLVAVAVTRSGGSEVVKLYRVKNDGSLEYAGGDNDPFVWKSAGETVSLRAWSYGTSTDLSYTLTAPETRDYTLETDQQTNGYRELLYCKADSKRQSDGAITLNFYHQLARMVFNVTHESASALTISSVSIGGSSFPKTARFIVPTESNVGTWVVKSGTGSITPRTETPPTTGYLATYSAVVFPTFTTQNYPKDTPFFTVTSGTNNYTYKIAESEGMAYAGNTQYNYTINVKDFDYKKNPLWYVAPYNMVNATTMATTERAGYYYLWSTAVAAFGAQSTSYTDYKTAGKSYSGQSGTWHLPVRDEWRSIIPGDNASGVNILKFDSGTGTYKASNLTVKFGYNATTKAGMEEASYWKEISSTELHAIRFLGTPYCSAWKYVLDTSNYRFVISATLIDQVANSASAAATWYSANFASVTFDDNATLGRCQRTFWLGGHAYGDKSSASSWLNQYGYWWCATQDYYANIDTRWNLRSDNSGYSFQVRMFRDN